MRPYAVVVNDCAAPPVPGILHVRSQDTPFGQRNFSLNIDDLVHGLPALLTDRQMDLVEVLGHLFAVASRANARGVTLTGTARSERGYPCATPTTGRRSRPRLKASSAT